MTASTTRFAKNVGCIIVYERRIKRILLNTQPWRGFALRDVPHSVLDSEAKKEARRIGLEYEAPLKNRYAGLATSAKGFPELSHLATACTKAGVPCEFYSIGALHPECRGVDQTAMAQRAWAPLEQESFLVCLA